MRRKKETKKHRPFYDMSHHFEFNGKYIFIIFGVFFLLINGLFFLLKKGGML